MKLIFFFLQLLITISLGFFVTACTPKVKTPSEPEVLVLHDRDIKDLQTTYHAYQKLDGVDVTVFLKNQDLSEQVNNSFNGFEKNFIEMNSSAFSNVFFGKIKLKISQQSLRSQFLFSFKLQGHEQRIFGHIKAQHFIKAGVNQFILETNFNEVVLDKVDGSELQDNDENSQLIRSAVENFVHTLKVEMLNSPLSIDVDMNILSSINENSIYKAEDYSTHLARPIVMKTKMKAFVPYLSTEGLLILGASKLKKEDVGEVSIQELPLRLKNQVDSALMLSMGTSLSQVQKYSSYYISKKYMAEQMNTAFAYMDMRVINKFFMKLNRADANISKSIYFFDKNNLPACSGLQDDCKKNLKSCNKHCPMKYGIQNCSSCEEINNPFEKVRCLSKIESCRSSQEKSLYQCHKNENNCVAKNRNVEKNCEIYNVQKISVCREKKDDIVFINDEIVLAKLNLNFTVPSSYAVQRLRSIKFNKNLTQVEVMRNLHLSMESQTSVLLEMNSYKDLNCTFKMTKALLTHSELDYVNQKRKLNILSQTLSNGRLKLSAISKPSFMSSELKNSPYEALIKRKNFTLMCTYQGMPMKSISGEELLQKKEVPYALNPLLSQIELPFQEEELSFIIMPVKLGTDILLFPTIEQKAIGFSRQAHFY